MTRREAIAALLAGPMVTVRSMAAQTSDLTILTIAQASERLITREIRPVQLAEAYLARIARLNPDLNAFVTVTRDLALREARNLRERSAEARPVPPKPAGESAKADLYGIPIAHKDLFETRGVRTTAGSLLF